MKYNLKISDRSYEVQIENIHSRPIIAIVDGQRFEVNPENESRPEVREEPVATPSVTSYTPVASQTGDGNELTAPLPGTIIEFFVKPGDVVEAGKVVVVIEAMKMKNSIRTTRGGKVVELLVSPGQTVTHKQALVRFE